MSTITKPPPGRVAIEELKPGDEGKFWIDSLGAKYHRFRINRSSIKGPIEIAINDSPSGGGSSMILEGIVGTASTAERDDPVLDIALFPIGSTDWTKAEKLNVIVKFGNHSASSSSRMEVDNPCKSDGDPRKGTGYSYQESTFSITNSMILPTTVYALRAWKVETGKTTSTASKPDREFSIVLQEPRRPVPKPQQPPRKK